jgi:uncharacterized protein YndB with AHSA1/START domain
VNDPGTDAVVIERTFDAPLDLVWRMWTAGDEFASWYGPPGAAIPVAELDVRVGGKRLVCMEVTTPDGPMRMWFGGEHTTVEPPTRLGYTEQVTDENGVAASGSHATQVLVELTEVDGGTRVVMRHVGIPSDSPGAAGWRSAFDKLSGRLAQATP